MIKNILANQVLIVESIPSPVCNAQAIKLGFFNLNTH